jgi:hypothetical protein
MGRIRLYSMLLILIGLIIAIYFINPFMRLEDKVILKIYRAEHHEKINIYKILRRVPSSYKMNLSISEESNSKYIRIDISDTSDFNHYNYCYIYFKQDDMEGFLYAPPYFRCINLTRSECENYLSILIDTNLFNKY